MSYQNAIEKFESKIKGGVFPLSNLNNRITMKNISKEDFILWDTVNDKPLERHDIVYHYTTLVEIINTDGFKLLEGQEIRCVAELSIGWQKTISEAIEQNK